MNAVHDRPIGNWNRLDGLADPRQDRMTQLGSDWSGHIMYWPRAGESSCPSISALVLQSNLDQRSE